MLSKYFFSTKVANRQYAIFNSLLFEPLIVNQEEYNNILQCNINFFSDEDIELLYSKGIWITDPLKDDEIMTVLQNHISSLTNSGVSLIYIIPSNLCNLACKYCFIGKLNEKPEYISFDTIDKIIDEYAKHLMKKQITKPTIVFYGGEPLTAFDRIEYTVKKCLAYSDFTWEFAIVTNLTMLNQRMIDFFSKYNVSIGVSIDGSKSTNDKNRIFKYDNEKSVYDCVMEKLLLLKGNNINIGLSITLTNAILEDATFLSWLKGLNIKNINYNLLHFKKNTFEWESYYKLASRFLFTSHDYLSKSGIIDDRLQRKIRAFSSKEFKYNDCGAIGGHQLCFSPNGEVSVCHGYWNSEVQHCGNIQKMTFDDIFNTNVFLAWKNNLTVRKQECLSCPAIYICGGGCAMQSSDLFGDITAVDKAFCIHTKYSLQKLLENLAIVSI